MKRGFKKSRLHQQVGSGSGGSGSNVKVSVLNSRSFDNQAFHARCLSNHICCSAIFTEERANKNHLRLQVYTVKQNKNKTIIILQLISENDWSEVRPKRLKFQQVRD